MRSQLRQKFVSAYSQIAKINTNSTVLIGYWDTIRKGLEILICENRIKGKNRNPSLIYTGIPGVSV
ncbi:hypothetical protein GCM10011361_09710 [Muriicola marianensis]|uniref:Uncharacterized protein n=1 Tax=Muriicola marianensis TaxID=1324801 RepID=A0ABQ1QT79_9FLAO|nr:hypothetical protein GCM10011361_09710 [Muriicola marianensis]